jgi:hypothetical protein
MASVLKPQQLIIPTGYEGLQQKAASKRKLADVMLQSGMGMAQNPQHWAQVLGALAQQWVSKDAGKQADKFDLEAGQRLGADYQRKYAEFTQDAKTMQPGDVVAKWGGDPMAGDWIKPYASAQEAGLKEGQQLGYHDGRNWGRKADIAPGSVKPNDPNSKVIIGADGGWLVNDVATTAAMESLGQGAVQNGTYAMRDPAEVRRPKVDAFNKPVGLATEGDVLLTPEQFKSAVSSPLGVSGTVNWLKQTPNIKLKVGSLDEAERMNLPPGIRVVLPDGTELESE